MKEFVFLGVTCFSLLATAVFTVYKLATVSKSDTDFTFALVLLLNTCKLLRSPVTTLVVAGRKEGKVYLTTHSTHFIYGYMASDVCEGPL